MRSMSHKGDSVTFPVTIDAPSVANGQYQGRIDLVPRKGANKVTIPVAFVKKQGAVTLSNSCCPCQLPGAPRAPSARRPLLRDRGELLAAVGRRCAEHRRPEQGKKLEYKNVGAPGSVIGAGDGVQWSGTLSPAIPPQVTGVNTPGSSPAGGYLPLSLFGGSRRFAGVGDDTITNFNVPQLLLRRRAVHEPRRRVERLPRARWRHQCRHRVHAAALPERGAAEQRGRTDVERPQHHGGVPGDMRSGSERPHRRRQHLDRRRLAAGQELRQRDDPTRSRSGSASRAALPHGPGERGRSLLVRHGRRRR